MSLNTFRLARRTRPTNFQHYAAAPDTSEQTDDSAPATDNLPTHWAGIIGMETVTTGDGRLIDEGALEWSTPIPLRFVQKDVGAHDGAVVVGRILTIERGEGGAITATGDFDLDSEDGREAARLVGKELLNGVSMDLDSVSFEVRVKDEVIRQGEAEQEALADSEPAALPEADENGRVKVYESSADDEIMATTSARVRAATIVSVPAFAEAVIYGTEAPALVASAAPVDPPAAWFQNPNLTEPTPFTITEDGRVYGHLASWNVCHVADPAGYGQCVMAPKTNTDYAYFHTGVVKTAEGAMIPTGPLMFNTGHAKGTLSAGAASAHYDNTGTAGADVHVGEDSHGIWVAGAIRPGLSAEQLRVLRASPLSGDWRYIGSNLELVGALAVNLPGFPIPRPAGLVASGEMTSMVAVGVVAAPRHLVEAAALGFSSSDLAYIQSLIEREKLTERTALARRAKVAMARVKVKEHALKLARMSREIQQN